ncbi:MAG: tetratricopeptide repeat protein [Bacteroidetes bacterium]|nr:tetratricopeptide repeat protein [Bacteroidota bacterium]
MRPVISVRILPVLIFQLLFSAVANALPYIPDSLLQKVVPTYSRVDSLQKQLSLAPDSLKGAIYTQLAAQYQGYDTISNRKRRLACEENVLSNTYSALHYYSRYNDTTGLRTCFDNLARVYHAQKKYPQAKWFILQSNTLSRAKNDNPNIITSLIELASIKTDIKDYQLAMRDLNEALTLSSKNHYPLQEEQVQLSCALLYNRMKNPGKAAIALKRYKAIGDSMHRADVIRIAKNDSVQAVKKKLYTSNSRKRYKLRSGGKTSSS